MQNYWTKHFNDAATVFAADPLKQVGKTVNGKSVDPEQIELLANCVSHALQVGPDELVVDLCCGNGILTKCVASQCRKVLGIDFAENLIAFAKRHYAGPNVEYRVDDVTELDSESFAGASKVYMYEAIQHLSVDAFSKILRKIHDSSSVDAFFVGSIPDRATYDAFYDTPAKRDFARTRELSGQPHIGIWWEKKAFSDVVEAASLVPNLMVQQPKLHTSRFRFDCLITRR
jgi:cyclopropane fatty-acyl-phospholipid synthase-like methyltransferase